MQAQRNSSCDMPVPDEALSGAELYKSAARIESAIVDTYRSISSFSEQSLWSGFGAYFRNGCNHPTSRFQRPNDGNILHQIALRSAERADSTAIDCLEVGAGRTYVAENQIGFPWWSRAIAKTLPGKVNIVATDLTSSLSWIIVTPDGRSYSGNFHPAEQAGILSKISETGSGQFTAEALNWSAAAGYYGQTLQQHLNKFPHGVKTTASLYIRPAFDPEVERIVFGLKARNAVDFSDIRRSFPDRKFDFIFGRHLDKHHLKDEALLRQSLSAALAAEGTAELEFEETCYASQLTYIRVEKAREDLHISL